MNPKSSYLTVSQQIATLKSKGVVFKHPKTAQNLLEQFSYFSIVNSYREPFAFPLNRKLYLNGTTFEEIYALYHFDKRLREGVFPALLDAEAILKNKVVNAFLGFTDASGNHPYDNEAYLLLSSYDKSHAKEALNVIASCHQIISKHLQQSEAFSHYLTTYSYVPLWVLETKMTFGNLCHLYGVLNTNVRQAVAMHYHMTDRNLKTVMEILTAGRNACAHRDRLYCLHHQYLMPTLNVQRYPSVAQSIKAGYGKHDFFAVLLCLRIVLGSSAIKPCVNWIKNELNILGSKLKTITA